MTKLCTCQPPVPGYPDYGQSWTIDRHFTAMTCSRCGGAPRPEQDRQMAEEWTRGMALPSPKPFSNDYPRTPEGQR